MESDLYSSPCFCLFGLTAFIEINTIIKEIPVIIVSTESQFKPSLTIRLFFTSVY